MPKRASTTSEFRERFTGRAKDYFRYRPDYPRDILAILAGSIGFGESWVVADIGSGTGRLSRLFLENGNRVLCVEPNRDMRSSAEKNLSSYAPLFASVAGSAEATGLKQKSADLVVAGQALHWFDLDAARSEFRRIMRRNGHIAIIYNYRSEGGGVQAAYEKLVNKYRRDRGPDTPDVDDAYVAKFLGNKSFKKFLLHNSQTLDHRGLVGRLASASYMPPRGSREWAMIREDVRKIIQRYGTRGYVEMHYATTMYLGSLNDG